MRKDPSVWCFDTCISHPSPRPSSIDPLKPFLTLEEFLSTGSFIPSTLGLFPVTLNHDSKLRTPRYFRTEELGTVTVVVEKRTITTHRNLNENSQRLFCDFYSQDETSLLLPLLSLKGPMNTLRVLLKSVDRNATVNNIKIPTPLTPIVYNPLKGFNKSITRWFVPKI